MSEELVPTTDIQLYDYGLTKEDVKSPAIQEVIENIKKEASFWDNVFNVETPEAETYEREGPKDKSGNPTYFEYVKDSYTIRMLNKLFPGWYQEDMKIEYIAQVTTWVVSGYIIIRYPTSEGIKTRKIWAVGAQAVQIKKDLSGGILPSQPEDMAKGAYTEWMKLVGKRLGIGVDIFEQSITESMMQEYTDIVKHYDDTSITDQVIGTLRKKKLFKDYISNLPNEKQAIIFKEIVEKAPPQAKIPLWQQFQKHTKNTVDKFINELKQKLGVSNEQ